MKKTLFIMLLPPPYGGVEIVCQDLINSTIFSSSPTVSYIDCSIRKTNKSRGGVDIDGIWGFVKVYIKLLSKITTVDNLWVYISSSPVGFLKDSLFIITAKLCNVRVIANYQGDMFREFLASVKPFYRRYINWVIGIPSDIVVSTEQGKCNFPQIAPRKLHSIPNGFNIGKFALTNNTNVPYKTSLKIFYIGHLSYPKGFYHLVRSYKVLYNKYGNNISIKFAGEYIPPRKELTIFLSGREKAEYLNNQIAIHNEIEEFINSADKFNSEYLGLIDYERKIIEYADADICVFPSFTESFGNTIVESLLMGKLVVATNVGILKEVSSHIYCGEIIRFGDEKSIVEKIEKLMGNEKLRITKGQEVSAFARKLFNVETTAKEIFNLIDNKRIDNG